MEAETRIPEASHMLMGRKSQKVDRKGNTGSREANHEGECKATQRAYAAYETSINSLDENTSASICILK